MHLGGGFHHAFAGRAEGFCYLNDTAVAARLALTGEAGFEPGLTAISVVDLDVHQGNGTARIFQDDPGVFTFSIHQENNYPPKEQGDLDIGLADGTADQEYLQRLEQGIETAIRAQSHQVLETHVSEYKLSERLVKLSPIFPGERSPNLLQRGLEAHLKILSSFEAGEPRPSLLLVKM